MFDYVLGFIIDKIIILCLIILFLTFFFIALSLINPIVLSFFELYFLFCSNYFTLCYLSSYFICFLYSIYFIYFIYLFSFFYTICPICLIYHIYLIYYLCFTCLFTSFFYCLFFRIL